MSTGSAVTLHTASVEDPADASERAVRALREALDRVTDPEALLARLVDLQHEVANLGTEQLWACLDPAHQAARIHLVLKAQSGPMHAIARYCSHPACRTSALQVVSLAEVDQLERAHSRAFEALETAAELGAAPRRRR